MGGCDGALFGLSHPAANIRDLPVVSGNRGRKRLRSGTAETVADGNEVLRRDDRGELRRLDLRLAACAALKGFLKGLIAVSRNIALRGRGPDGHFSPDPA